MNILQTSLAFIQFDYAVGICQKLCKLHKMFVIFSFYLSYPLGNVYQSFLFRLYSATVIHQGKLIGL